MRIVPGSKSRSPPARHWSRNEKYKSQAEGKEKKFIVNFNSMMKMTFLLFCGLLQVKMFLLQYLQRKKSFTPCGLVEIDFGLFTMVKYEKSLFN